MVLPLTASPVTSSNKTNPTSDDGYVNIDLMSYCATSQLGTNYFSIVTNDSYLMYQETATTKEYKANRRRLLG